MKSSFGIIGFPLKHTLSPTIHNFWFQELNLNASYHIFEIEKLDRQTLVDFQNSSVQGLSVTIPYKQQVFSYADRADDSSNVLQSSNTLTFKKDKIFVYNTDGKGALKAIKTYNKDLLEKKILILGTGGSARGILAELLNCDRISTIFLSGRNQKAGLEITNLFSNLVKWIDLDSIFEIQKEIFLIIHTTPLGMMGNYEQKSLLSKDFFLAQHTLFDIVYRPFETLLIQNAKEKKSNILYGYEMLLYQAVLQFEHFTGIQLENQLIEKTKLKLQKILLSSSI